MVTLRVMTSLFAAFTLAIAFSGSAVRADGVTMEDLVNDQKTTTDVLTWGMGLRGQRYSTLDKINKDNISALIPAWSFSFGGGDSQRGEESQPLYRDGIIYVTGSRSRMWAIDARTGQEKWQYNPRLPDGADAVPCCDVVNRGAAIFGDKVFLGTIAARLVALNAETGKVVWNKSLGDIKEGYSYTAAPMVVDGKVITGVSGGEYGIVGRVDARDTETGDLIWSRPVVEGHVGELNGKPSTMTGKLNETWPGDTWKHGGGATWLGGSYDPDTKLLYFGTGNPAPWNAHFRKGDNRWTSARIAINPDNGEIVWGFQTTPNDGWDYDGVNEFILFDMEDGGKTVKAGATADRNGFFYVLDRTNGKFIRGLPFVEQITWAKGLDENGRPILGDALPGDPRSTPDKKKGTAADVTPPFFGGKNQSPMAYSQQTGLFYVPANEWTMNFWYEGEPVYKKGQYYIAANFTLKPLDGFDHIGSLKAVDPVKGEIKWEVNNRAPLWGGVMTTAGGLVFYGTPEGFLKALDAETGKELWKFQTGSGIVAPPITWEMDGEQYIGIASGWGGAVPLWGGEVNKFAKYTNEGGSFWVFKLHKRLAAN